MTAMDVITGSRQWSCEEFDSVAWLNSLPDDSVDLLFTSPPYEAKRTYGISFKLRGQAWVDWMVTIVRAAAPKVKGLIAINCEGGTEKYRYSCVPFLLIADLHRAEFNLRKPAIYQRFGIPGSGGPDWLRNDYEPVICVTRKGKLPWSCPTAQGKPPVYSAGGAMSNRTQNGTRVTSQTRRKPDGTRLRDGKYKEPEIANPGNIIRCKVGGGLMGHPLATQNEAPFPLKLATFFVLTFCPPGGVVADCFGGSGTTMHAAVENGRRGISCDLRASQVELCEQRMRTVNPSLLTEL